MLTWDVIQQVVRIILYSAGAFLFGDAVADGAPFQGLIGGVVNVGAFAWWFYVERNRVAAAK